MAVGWYLRFSLSYRDVEELLAERGLPVDHVTVWRWVQRYAPELDRRLRKRLKTTNDSWRVTRRTCGSKGKWAYLYRAVDSTGATIDFLLGQTRCSGGRALSDQSLHSAWRTIPRRGSSTPKSTLLIRRAIVELKASRVLEEKCTHRPVQYLNNSLGTGSPGHQTPGACKPAFSLLLLLGSLAHDRRRRSDSYDSQRPGVRE